MWLGTAVVRSRIPPSKALRPPARRSVLHQPPLPRQPTLEKRQLTPAALPLLGERAGVRARLAPGGGLRGAICLTGQAMVLKAAQFLARARSAHQSPPPPLAAARG